MYSNQQPHSSNGNYQHNPNPSRHHASYNSTPVTNYSRSSSSASSAVSHQQVAEFDNGNTPQQHPYNQSSVYGSDAHYHYTTSPHTTGPSFPPFQAAEQRSASDGVNYPMRSHELDGTTAFRRTGHPGSTRARTMSLSSYAQPADSARPPSADYSQHKYMQDSRYTSQAQAHPYPQPPSSYRAGAASPTMGTHSLPRPVPTRMTSTPISHTGSTSLLPPLPSQPSAYPQARRGSSASLTSGLHKSRAITLDSATSSSTPVNQARPHVCDFCGLAFVRGHDLKRHKDTHTNSKPHVCECGKSFSRKDALKRHIHLKSCRGEKPGGGYATSEE